MVYILGGYSDLHGFNNDLYVWKLKCNRWVHIPRKGTIYFTCEILDVRPSQPAKLLKSNTGGVSFCWFGMQYAIPYSQKYTPPHCFFLQFCRLRYYDKDSNYYSMFSRILTTWKNVRWEGNVYISSGTWRQNDVIWTLERRQKVKTTSMQRCSDVVGRLGWI